MNHISLCLLLGLGLTYVLCVDDQQMEKDKKDEVLKFKKPEVQGFAYIAESFDSKEDFGDQWTLSQAKKDGVEAAISKYDGQWVIDEPEQNAMKGDKALILREKAKHHAASTMLPKKFEFKDKPLIVQYEVKFQNALECGGAYMKLLSDQAKLDLDEFTDKTPYTIMFGPDKCGEDSKLHFIFRHKNPITGEFEEKHAKKPTGEFSKVFDDKKTHLFTLIVSPDNTFEVRVDKELVNSGSLLNDFKPSVNPPVEIDDPEDKKPDDWDEREKIVDATAKKPDDWDEDAPLKIPDPNAKKPEGWLDDAPENIPDPSAVKPADWDTEEDGEWEPPQIPNPKCSEVGCGEWKPAMIDNPKYKGKWEAPLIPNPAFKGIWKPRQIKNPNYFEDMQPFKMTAIAAVGFELWSMTENISFDNIIIASDRSVVDKWTADTWDLKFTQEFSVADSGSGSLWSALQDAPKERPWLWAVYVAVILLPIILIFACCFPSKKDDAAVKKKTDEPTEDDTPEQQEEQKEEGEKVQEETKENEEDGEKNAEEKQEEPEAEAAAEEVDSSTDEQEEHIAAKGEQIQAVVEDHLNKVDEALLATEDQTQSVNPENDDHEDMEPAAEPEQDIPPPDASPRTRASRRKTRKDT